MSIYFATSFFYISFGRWVVENQIGKKDLVIDDCDSKQSVYVFGCKDSVLQVKGSLKLCGLKICVFIFVVSSLEWDPYDSHYAGKVNNITVDKCIKMGIVFKVSAYMPFAIDFL